MVKSSTKIQNEHLVCYVSTLHLKEIAYFSDILCRNYVSLYESGGFVCLLHMNGNTLSIAANRNFA